MIVPVMAISNLVLTQQIYSEETNGAHAHYREPVPLKLLFTKFIRFGLLSIHLYLSSGRMFNSSRQGIFYFCVSGLCPL